MATIKEVAKLSGVSKATVSRVLTGNAKVNPETYDKVMRAMQQLDYKPNTVARNLASRRSNAIGVLVGDIASPFYGTLLKGIEMQVESVGMQLIMVDGNEDEKKAKDAVEFLINQKCEALLICQSNISDYYIRFWIEKGHHLVCINRYLPELEASCIYVDNEVGGFLATQHLVEHGHRRIVHLAGPLSIIDSQLRMQGYQRALKEHGIAFDPKLVLNGTFDEESGYINTRVLIQQKVPFTAIFAGNDHMAAGAMAAIFEAGLKIPDDVSIVGFDDIIWTRYLYPPLTTIHQPLLEMGQTSVELVLNSASSAPPPFIPTLVQRRSVAKRL